MTKIPGRFARIDKGSAMIVEPRTPFTLWTPAQLSPVAWWDMSNEALITEAGGAVSQVDDKSGNDRHLIQTNGSYKPVTGSRTINGKNVLEFDTSNWLQNTADASDIFPVSTDINIFAIASRDVSASEDMFFYVNSNPTPGVTASDSTWDGLGNGSQNYLEAVVMFDDFVNTPRTTIQDATNWFSLNASAEEYNTAEGGDVPIFLSRFERGAGTKNLKRWVNSNEKSSVITSTQNGNVATTLVIGGHGSLGSTSRRLDGVVGEIIVTHGALSEADRLKVEGFLAHRWGLTENLPFGHKYKYSPPRII